MQIVDVRVVLLSGGVGGAKLAAGLYDVLAPGELTIVGNVGDDLEVLGLSVSPDLDSLLYGLAGLNDTERGWGRPARRGRRSSPRAPGAAKAGSRSATSTSASTSSEPQALRRRRARCRP